MKLILFPPHHANVAHNEKISQRVSKKLIHKTGPTFTLRNSILLSFLLTLLDKVMSHNQ